MVRSSESLWQAAEGQVEEAVPTGRLSYSRLSRYQRCGEAYKLQYVDEVPMMRSGAACAGSAVHSVIEIALQEGWWTDEKTVAEHGAKLFLEQFDQELREAEAVFLYDDEGRVADVTEVMWGGRKRVVYDELTGKPVQREEVLPDGTVKMRNVLAGENYHFFRNMGPTWVKRAAAILRMDAERGIVVVDASVERQVSAWLDGPGSTLITGFIDVMMLANEDGEPIIQDWKTGTWSDPMQLANYAWLLENLEQEEARITANIGRIAYLRGTTKDKWIKEYDLSRWKPIVPRLYHDALKGMEAGVYGLQQSSFCGSCWVKSYCEYGKTLTDE